MKLPDKILLILTCTFIAACSVQNTDPGDASGAPRLQHKIPSLMHHAEIPGLQVAVIEDGEVSWPDSFGLADTQSDIPVTDQTLFEAASLSKPVFAYLVMKLVDSGQLNLDVPLYKVLKNERLIHDKRYRLITPRMVLTHTSGLPNWGGTPLELRFAPGSSFGYSGEGYVYLQHAVEKLTGKSLQNLAHELVFVPLGMDRSQYLLTDKSAERARGHDRIGAMGRKASADAENAAASLVTTASDYARFVGALMKQKGLTDKTASLMLKPAIKATHPFNPGTPANAPMAWTSGFGADAINDNTVLWHWGDNGVFRSFVAFSPELQRGVVYLANSQNGLTIMEEVNRIIFGSGGNVAKWLNAEQWDSPASVLRRDLLNTFRNQGEAAMLEKIASLASPTPENRYTLILRSLAGLLQQLGTNDTAVTVLGYAEHGAPDDLALKQALAEALLGEKDYQAAAKTLQEALELADNANKEPIHQRLEWIHVYIEADPPAEIDPTPLTGNFGARKIWTQGDDLLYQRGEGAIFKLRPITQTLFEVGDLSSFRLQFNINEDGVAESVTGLYIDGQKDESQREP